jgi:hypothetical protein
VAVEVKIVLVIRQIQLKKFQAHPVYDLGVQVKNFQFVRMEITNALEYSVRFVFAIFNTKERKLVKMKIFKHTQCMEWM